MDRLTRGRLLAGALVAALCGGCTFHSTDSTEVGVLTRKVTFFGLLGHQGAEARDGQLPDQERRLLVDPGRP